MKIGIIGFGSMGSMIANGLVESAQCKEDDIFIYTLFKHNVDGFKSKHPKVHVYDSSIELAKTVDMLFLCVKPLEMLTVLDEISAHLKSTCHIISIAGCVVIENIEKMFAGKITRIMPTAISQITKGVTLTCHNPKVNDEDKNAINIILTNFGKVKEIQETDFEAVSDLTSCGPGLIAGIFEEFVKAGVRNSTLSYKEVHSLVLETLFGTAKMLFEQNMDFNQMVERVATKGGITEEGIKVISTTMPDSFDLIFAKTLEKHELIKAVLLREFDDHNQTKNAPKRDRNA